MQRLAQRDIEKLLSYLREVYVCCDLESFASRLVSTLPRILASETVSYLEMDLPSRKPDGPPVVEPPSPDYASEASVFERHIQEHPLINYYRQTGDHQAVKISDFLTERQWHNTALYNDFYKALRGIEHQMAIVIPTINANAGFAFSRIGKDFSERDRSVLDLLRPHLVQAYQNAAAMTRRHREATRFRRTVEESRRGMIVLHDRNRIRWCNEAAERWLQEYFKLSLGVDRLPEELDRWVEHHKSLLRAGGSVPKPRTPLTVKKPAKHLSVRLLAEDQEDETDLLIMEERSAPLSIESLRAIGFTTREAEIMIHVANGKTNEEIAKALFVSPRTVKKHLDNVYRKFSVTSRAEALYYALQNLQLPQRLWQ